MHPIRNLAALLPLLAAPALADGAAADYAVDASSSSVSYQIVHKLHKVQGTSTRPEGKGRLLPDGRAQVMVRVPVESFDSGNGNRDAHMKETVDAVRFATVELKATAEGVRPPPSFPGTVERVFHGELNFHGIKKTVDVPTKLTFESADRVRATASFPISLDGHKIERPSLMFVKVDDAAQIEASLLFKR